MGGVLQNIVGLDFWICKNPDISVIILCGSSHKNMNRYTHQNTINQTNLGTLQFYQGVDIIVNSSLGLRLGLLLTMMGWLAGVKATQHPRTSCYCYITVALLFMENDR